MERTKFDVFAHGVQHARMQFFVPGGQEPVTWWRGKPIHLTTVIVLLHVPAMILTSVMMGTGWPANIGRIVFSVPDLLRGEWWRPFTFLFLIPPSFWLVIGLVFFWQFGRAVEGVLGWRKFLGLYLVLCFTPAVASLFCAAIGRNFPVSGTMNANFAVFVAFAILYPEANMFLLNVAAKWVAIGFVAVGVLAEIASPASGLLGAFVFLSTIAACYLFLKFQGIRGGFSWFNRWKEEREEARYEKIQKKRLLESKEHFISDQVDPILDKIAREGMQSLTEEEKGILARAKDKLR